MKRLANYLIISSMVICNRGFSQIYDYQTENRMEQVIESISESEDGDVENSEILEDISHNAEHPVNINMASEEELEKLNVLDFRQIHNIISYRKQYGYFVSNYELAAVEGITPEIAAVLNPFISFAVPSDSINQVQRRFDNSIITRVKTSFPQARGFRSVSAGKAAVYPGPPISMYNRFQVEIPGKLEFGLIADNDAGEQFFSGSNKAGFDYYSGFVLWKGRGIVHQVIAGDFLLRFGQGVSFGSGSSLGKSVNALGILKSGHFVRPSTSSDENRYFRGISAILGSGPLRFMLFYSNKNRDANIISDKESGTYYFTSLQTSGYHRTSSEIEDERSVNEQVSGGYGELKFNRFRIGVLCACQKFDLPMLAGTAPYKARSFSGTANYNLGFDYQLAYSRIQFFGEGGLSKSGKPGVVQGMIWHIHPQVSWSSYFRYFDPGFHNFYGSSLSESSGNRNETGLFNAVMLYPVPKMKISFYVDFYHFPWLTYSTIESCNGSDWVAQIDFSLSTKLSMYLKGKYETKPQKLTGPTGVAADWDEKTTRLRIHTQYVISDRLSLRFRCEYSGYSFSDLNEDGFLIFQDIVYSPFHKLEMWLRFAWFNTDGYNSRIYTYENDLLYSYSIPEFHGKGTRLYLNFKWSPSSCLTAYFKAGFTVHDGVSVWGSGNDVTAGDRRTELKGLIYYRF